jgi:hypothetical protein
MALREAIQRIALEFPSYGWRRITAQLRRQKWVVNHKRVYRWMRSVRRSEGPKEKPLTAVGP